MASTSVHSHSPASIPTVLFPLTLPALLKYILATQSTTTTSPTTTTLVVCSSRDVFLQALLSALQQEEEEDAELGILGQLITPTLHSLFTSRHVKVAFCSSVQNLLAYLAACSRSDGNVKEKAGKERLVLVNPLSLHAPTPSFSAQGLSRTFAAAVETAFRLDARLWVVECEDVGTRAWDHSRLDGEDEEMMQGVMETHEEEDQQRAQATSQEDDPWEQDVPILNVSARRYGSGSGDRAWAGRTVNIRRIAGRWFHFRKVDELSGIA
ncbi:hypothetical protein BDV96DRAFT_640751 [Lophiotrema nucula]|uniref:Uncharacterized protein n=1 Tax=Lophiotrema nucula TaxID=690887 RepID=A0A6A5ZR67_9PLEO|nr:hypothetical protein BDV96DRAFT_640751 [Lophiotrema nucula]